jgi:DNA-binding transcriptional MerR regulator/effector-binding domain-containing protein
VAVLVPIGEFSKMTYLSVKALRHYHDVGLLEPAAVEPDSGYRRYSSDQVPVAQAIRRFRDLDMPLDDIRRVIEAPDLPARNAALVEHLGRMQAQLARTQQTVASLQTLLSEPAARAGTVLRRSEPARRVLAIVGRVAQDDCAGWLDAALAELHALVAEPAGPDGALYAEDFFLEAEGGVTAYVPITAGPTVPTGDRAAVLEVPAAELAVLVHEGSFDDIDRTYGELGTWVMAEGIAAAGAIREQYFSDTTAEVAWPVVGGPDRSGGRDADELRGPGQRREVALDAGLAGVHRVDAEVGGAGRPPAVDLAGEALGVVGVPRHPPLHGDGRRVAPGRLGGGPDHRDGVVQVVAGADLREPAVGQAADPAVGGIGRAADPDRDGTLHRQGREAGAGDAVVVAVERQRRLGEEAAQQPDLLAEAAAPLVEGLAEGLVLHGVPAQADAEPEPAVGEEVDLGGLLRHEGRLALREDDDAGDQLEGGDPGQVAEHHEGLVERGEAVVGPVPGLVHARIGPEDMVVGQQVGEAEGLDALPVGPHRPHIATELRLREDHTDLHRGEGTD